MILKKFLNFQIIMVLLPHGTISKLPEICLRSRFREIFMSSNSEINIEKCEFQVIDIGTPRKTIKILKASQNLFKSLEDKDLAGATELVDIDLSRNRILDISCDAFKDQSKLTHLKLSYNRLKRLTPGIFDALIRLVALNVEVNNLMVIEGELFTNNSKLSLIDFSFNNIIAITPDFRSAISNASADLTGNICDDSRHENDGDSKEKLSKCFKEYKNFHKKLAEYSDKYHRNCKVLHHEYENYSDSKTEEKIVIHIGVVVSVMAIMLVLILIICGGAIYLMYFVPKKKGDQTVHSQYYAVTEAPGEMSKTPYVHDEEPTYIEMT